MSDVEMVPVDWAAERARYDAHRCPGPRCGVASKSTGAELLRAAVARCRELDATATIAPWTEPERDPFEGWVVFGGGVPGSAAEHSVLFAADYNPNAEADARYAAAFRAIAAPLADLLEGFANPVDDEVRNVDELLAAVARALLPDPESRPATEPDGRVTPPQVLYPPQSPQGHEGEGPSAGSPAETTAAGGGVASGHQLVWATIRRPGYDFHDPHATRAETGCGRSTAAALAVARALLPPTTAEDDPR